MNETPQAPFSAASLKPPLEEVDVVVVGAGPAGSLTALILARAGKRVVLLDKARWPRAKVCGDCVHPAVWELWKRHGLEEGFRQLPHASIKGVTFELNGKPIRQETFATDTGTGENRAVERLALDKWLCEEAQKSGVVFLPQTHVQSLSENGEIQAAEHAWKAAHIVGADGRNSQIARLSGLAGGAGSDGRIAWEAELESSEIASEIPLDDHVHLNVFPEGHYGLVRLGENHLNLAMVLGKRTSASPQSILWRFFPDAKPLVWRSLYPVSKPPARPTNGRVWLVGDAARVIEPFTGEGIFMALSSAELAAAAILKCDPANRSQAARGYCRSHRELYRKRVRVNRLCSAILQHPALAVKLFGFFKKWPGLLSKFTRQVQENAKEAQQRGPSPSSARP